MKSTIKLDVYTPEEEKANFITHGLGALLSVVGAIALLAKSPFGTTLFWSNLIFGVSLILLYSSSTIYHFVVEKKRKLLFKTLDHIAIYILIAGTFTPFSWAVLGAEPLGQNVLLAVWLIALAGTVFKIFFIGRFETISLISYLGMGWLGYMMFDRIGELLSEQAVNLMLYGGACYTGGIVFYLWSKLKYHHAIWHLFVLGGSAFHFMAVYHYILLLEK